VRGISFQIEEKHRFVERREATRRENEFLIDDERSKFGTKFYGLI
jgi:hypothetical protein